MATLAFLACIVVVAGAATLVWLNRASDRVVGPLVPILFAACASVVATVLFAQRPPLERDFPVTFIFRQADRVPLTPPFRPFPTDSLFQVGQALQQEQEAVMRLASERLLYHHLLQKTFIDWMAFRFQGHWRLDALKFDTAIGTMSTFGAVTGATEPIVAVPAAAIRQALHGNHFASMDLPLQAAQLALPPGGRLTVTVPEKGQSTGTIEIRTTLCTLTLTTHFLGYLGGPGRYAPMMGIPSNEMLNAGIGTESYSVRARATFSRLRVGDPMMPVVQQWATQVIDGLKDEFDEGVMWRKTQEDYVFSQHLPEELRPRVPTLTFGAPENAAAPK